MKPRARWNYSKNRWEAIEGHWYYWMPTKVRMEDWWIKEGQYI
jgi:hypothetical protein